MVVKIRFWGRSFKKYGEFKYLKQFVFFSYEMKFYVWIKDARSIYNGAGITREIKIWGMKK